MTRRKIRSIADLRTYVKDLINKNPEETPEKLMTLADTQLSDTEKLTVFRELMRTPIEFQLNNNHTDVKHNVMPTLGRVAQSFEGTSIQGQQRAVRSGHDNSGSKFGRIVAVDELRKVLIHTHNSKRADPWIPLEALTVYDLECRQAYFFGRSTTMRAEADRCGTIIVKMLDNKATVLGDIWDTVRDVAEELQDL